MIVSDNPSRFTEIPKRKSKPIESPIDLVRFTKAVQEDYRDMQPFREKRYYCTKQLAGDGYGDSTSPEMPVNLLAVYFDVITSATVANQPRVMYSTFDEGQEAVVQAFQDWANPEFVAMDAASVFRNVIYNALSWVGITRVALADAADAAESGWGLQAGQPFMESIDPDCWVCDQGATSYDRIGYAGCKYRLPVEVANELYKRKNQPKFEASMPTDYNWGGDYKIESIGRTRGYREEIEDHTNLWEFWLPRHKQMMILRDNAGMPDHAFGPVAVVDWIGPRRGPFHYLRLGDVPGNLNPNGPANKLCVINSNFNSAWRKVLRETRDYKKIGMYRGANTKDADRIKTAKDGEFVNVEDPQAVVQGEFNGAGNPVWVMIQAMQAAFNYLSGNINVLGGRATGADTASQEKLLNENAGAGVASIQDRIYAHMNRSIESYNWFAWHHPIKVMKSQYQTPSYNGPEGRSSRELGPWDSDLPLKRNGPMPKMKLDVYALARQTPSTRMAFVKGVVADMAPLLPVLSPQGVMLDGNALIEMFADFGNEPKLNKIFRYQAPPQQEGSGGEDMAAGKPTSTTRTYQRYGAGGGDSQEEQAADLNTQFNQLQSGAANPNSSSGGR